LNQSREAHRWDQVADKPALLPMTVEETLRFNPSVPVWRRVTTRPVTLGGMALPKGAKLFLWLAAAGRDPRVFPERIASTWRGPTPTSTCHSARGSTTAWAPVSASWRHGLPGGARQPVPLGASAVLTRRTWAWAAATGARAVALAGVLWGMVAIAAGRGPHTQLNDTYHRMMVALLGVGLILLLTRPGRTALDIHKPGSDPTG